MYKEKLCQCKECGEVHVASGKYLCDECGYELNEYCIKEIGKCISNIKGNIIELRIEGTRYDFCSLECLKTFINKELEKE
jgi:tRNA(Ile2) C34 agmatinyltransferase TiaS